MSRSPRFMGALILAAGLVALLVDPGPAAAAVGSFANSAPITIQDNAPATPYPSTITVLGLSGTITQVAVTLSDLSHTFSEDIDILLVGPGGQTVLLVSDVGAATTIGGVTVVLEDGAPALPPPIVSGTFRPTNLNDSNTLGTSDEFPAPAPAPPYGTALAVFAGTDPNGIWQLFVRDDARVDEGSLAGGWCLTITTDAAGGGTTSCTPTLSVTTSGEGQVTSTPPGLDCGATCEALFDAGAVVTLSALPAPGFIFTGWSGGGCAGTGDCAVTLVADTIVTATFASLPGGRALSVTKTGPGLGDVTGTPGGILCGTDCAETYPGGTVIMLRATGRRGSLFAGWSGGGCAGTGDCLVTLNLDTTVTAVFPAPSDRPVILEPQADDAPLTAGADVTFSWTAVPGASQYGFEHTGANLAFSNPGGTSPDTDNGFGGSGGGFLVEGTSEPITIPAGIPPGAYQVRVVGLTLELAGVGRFSEAVTVLVGARPGGQPAFSAPADGSVVLLGSFVAFTWSAVPDATQYLFEFTGPDPGGLGGTRITSDTSVPAIVPTNIPAGPYRIRVLGLTDGGVPVGQFSPALTVIIQ
jgi:subtilisin-like proprotein convertase family protein